MMATTTATHKNKGICRNRETISNVRVDWLALLFHVQEVPETGMQGDMRNS
jgi:hypothetical protein